ncbi:MAG: hypothetical protein LBH77_04230, partial [Tannerella sp.]|nr:hypothetical protein [Tannerella sp.]
AFWFDPDGGYRTWRKNDWPDGPDRWIKACKAHNLVPGLWFSTNRIMKGLLHCIPEWENSLAANNHLCLFEGDYLNHLMETFQMYADKGVKLFKFDFAHFDAATEAAKDTYSTEEIIQMNQQAFLNAIKTFRRKNPDVIIIAYNGFGGSMNATTAPFSQTVDLRWRWLEIFDVMYCGDPRLSDVPMMNFWRSKDLYSDHMVFQWVYNGVPLSRIDNFGALLGTTGTCYNRGNTAWKGTVLLSLARSSWFTMYSGNLELLNNADATWLARVQQTYMQLQKYGYNTLWGETPGTGKPYGYRSETIDGSILLTACNPSHSFQEIDLGEQSAGRILFHDKGFTPVIKGGKLILGPEQLTVVGFGGYNSSKYDWGVEDEVIIPQKSVLLTKEFQPVDTHSAKLRVTPPAKHHIQIFFQQCRKDGTPFRSSGGPPPNGLPMDRFLQISAKQGGKEIPVKIEYDKKIWSGLSWAAGEIEARNMDFKQPLEITCTSKNGEAQYFKIEVYSVFYE